MKISVTAVNDLPVFSGSDIGSVKEDTSVVSNNISTSASLMISDPDTGESSFHAEKINGAYGALVINAGGSWTYTADNNHEAIQALDINETLSDKLTVTSADNSNHFVTITIHGTEDLPILGGKNTAIVAEDSVLTVNETLTIDDLDNSDNPISFVDEIASSGDNGYGTFSIIDNSWSYTLNNDLETVQELNDSETLVDTYTFTATDGSTQAVTITINGSNEELIFIPPSPEVELQPELEEFAPELEAELDPEIEAEPEKTILSDPILNETDINQPLELLAIDDDVLVEVFTQVFNETDHYEYQNEAQSSDNNQSVIPSAIELLNFDLAPLEFESINSEVFTSFTDNKDFVNTLEEMKHDLDEVVRTEIEKEEFKTEVMLGASASITVGLIGWVLRAGALMTSFMSISSLWRQFDPLPILGSEANKNQEIDPNDEGMAKDKNVEEIFTEEAPND
jgi:VCBS repeat-containing protein